MQRARLAEQAYDTDLQARPAAGTAEVGDLWRIPWSRRALVLGVAGALTLAALLYLVATPAQYAATAELLIDPRDRQIVSKDVNPDALSPDGGLLQVESQARVIESDAVLLRAVRALHLADDPDYGALKPGLLGRVAALLRGTPEAAGPAAAEQAALRVLRRHLIVKRADKVFVVDVVVTAASGPRAAGIADAIAEAYLADQAQSRSESNTRASDALSSRLGELRAGVKAAGDAVERYRAAHDLLGTDKQSISDQQLSDNGSQLNAARARVSDLQARADQLDALRRTGADGGAVPEALQSSVITQLRAALAELTRRQSDMRTRYGDRYPDLIAIGAEIRQARASIGGELDRLVRSAHSDVDRAIKSEHALATAQGTLKRQTISNDQAFVTLDELTRELDARRSIYNAFLARAGETREQSGIDTTNTRVISRAIPPVQASWPPAFLLLAGAAAFGLGLGAALAFLLEYLAPTVLSGAQLEAATGARVIGVVAGSGAALPLALGRLFGPLGALRHRARPRTLLVTTARGLAGAGPACGDALAEAASAADLSVLLVDADPGRAGPGEAGFLDVLAGTATLRETMVLGDTARVFRLPIGTPPAGDADVLSDGRLRQFLRMAERKFDLVVFLGGSARDELRTAALAAAVDDVLFVALRGATPQREAAEAAEAVAVSAGRPVSAALLVDRAGRL